MQLEFRRNLALARTWGVDHRRHLEVVDHLLHKKNSLDVLDYGLPDRELQTHNQREHRVLINLFRMLYVIILKFIFLAQKKIPQMSRLQEITYCS
jgi:hypothetical protein